MPIAPPSFSGLAAPKLFHRAVSACAMLVFFAVASVSPYQTASELPSCGYSVLVGLSR